MKLKLTNAKRLVNEKLEACEVLIEDESIKEISEKVSEGSNQQIDLGGKLISSGFVDVHVHLREPGGEAKETIASGTKAAAKGGFTTICSMPNTRPVPDCVETLNELYEKINQDAEVRVLPYASITKRQLGKEMVDIEALSEAGAFAFTDDGVGVQEAAKMFEAMLAASLQNKAVVAHCEDNSLVYGGVAHEGSANKKLKLPGIPSIAESVQIARDVLLAEAADCHYHVCHVSTKESVRVIRDAKRAGIKVTAEVTPHHLVLNENSIPGDDAMYKMNPPLRSVEDQEALIDGLLDGTIDCIATDHAPHTEEEKQEGFLRSPFGITGFETAFPILYTHLVKQGTATLEELINWMTVRPSELFSLPYGRFEKGAAADLVVIDLETVKTIDRHQLVSKGKNSPFHGWEASGWPVMTIMNGKVIWEESNYEAARS
ncbi:dihydroorotase [Halobacillus salinarum]|uniref:Dihydroorotase n=1 Tax=Halobacillus salinarum TaxID=2932257 RepID=A0ABY4EG53_9BACI|nr:dihydroorotase [Halobacillus salinarum]UOQ43114.1 dihydroorotase [Halobacillus salinarum]